MNFEQAAAKYVELRNEQDRITKEAKKKVAELEKLKVDIENWFSLRAQEEGLQNIPTSAGTAYWTTHISATCAEPSVFRQFVIDNGSWDLMEVRPLKTAVKSYVEGHGTPPPGINYSSIKVFNLRATKE